jgi:hypothetical protein
MAEKSIERCGMILITKNWRTQWQTTTSVTLSIIKLVWTGLWLNPVVSRQRSRGLIAWNMAEP